MQFHRSPSFSFRISLTLCALPVPEGRQGVEAAFVSSGTTIPLSPTENVFLRRLGTRNVDSFLQPVCTPGVPTTTFTWPLWQQPPHPNPPDPPPIRAPSPL